jgi:hypothetical protein
MIRLYTSFSCVISSKRLAGCIFLKIFTHALAIYDTNQLTYHRISSGFFKNNLLMYCLVCGVRKSMSDISAAILMMIAMSTQLLAQILPLKHTSKNSVRNSMDSLIRRFGLSNVCS